MIYRCIKITPGEYRLVVNNDLYIIQRQRIDFKTTWIADNIITSKPAFKADKKTSLIHQIIQHHEQTKS